MDEGRWLAAQRSKTIAIVVLVLLGPALAVTYALSIRPDLARSAPASLATRVQRTMPACGNLTRAHTGGFEQPLPSGSF